jgi:hypothetical protein
MLKKEMSSILEKAKEEAKAKEKAKAKEIILEEEAKEKGEYMIEVNNLPNFVQELFANIVKRLDIMRRIFLQEKEMRRRRRGKSKQSLAWKIGKKKIGVVNENLNEKQIAEIAATQFDTNKMSAYSVAKNFQQNNNPCEKFDYKILY